MNKELHVVLDSEVHRLFMVKCASDGTKASKKIRAWIRKFLDGELD